MQKESLRVAFFPDAYLEVDGVANTSRRFEAFARAHEFPLLLVYATHVGHPVPKNNIETDGSVTRVQLPRSRVGFNLDRLHDYDLLFLRHYRKLAPLLREFRPDIVQITGPSDVGILGALLSHHLKIPLAATWQTNLHQYARMRASSTFSFLPDTWKARLLPEVERGALAATLRFYEWPKLLFAPNQELIDLLVEKTHLPCLPMLHAVDTTVFTPAMRDRTNGPFRLGYVGRLTTEKNVRWLARMEQALVVQGHENFEIVVVGQGAEEGWLRKNMRKANFTGLLTGEPLSRAFANMDLFVFPSETDTFGLVILEALASGVPALVTSHGGPKFSVQQFETGFIARDFDEFASFAAKVLAEPELLPQMRRAARQHALSTSWDHIFEGMFAAYRRHLLPERGTELDVAGGRAEPTEVH